MNNKLEIDKLLEEIERVMSQFDKTCLYCDRNFKGNGHYCKSCQRQKKLLQILK